jgi:N-acetyl-gamma-glutamyl-phosphate reductase
LLITHPKDLKIELVTSETFTGQRVDRVLPNLRGFIDLDFEKLEIQSLGNQVDVVILAVPHKVAMEFVPQIRNQDIRVIDFSADYRLNNQLVYEKWYGIDHTDPSRMPNTIYGLPERYRDLIRGADLVANPGCYPTTSILPSIPIISEQLVELDQIIIDAKSGISGAGSKPKDTTHYPNRESNLVAYGLASHRHTPEIEQELSAINGDEIIVNFTPHLVPMTRGILTTLYFKLKQSMSTQDLLDVYADFYRNEPFIRVLDLGEYPQTKSVLGSNFCDIGLEVDPRTNRAIVMAAIDNLVKGASGAVVQNLNLMFGYDETAGLMNPGLMP